MYAILNLIKPLVIAILIALCMSLIFPLWITVLVGLSTVAWLWFNQTRDQDGDDLWDTVFANSIKSAEQERAAGWVVKEKVEGPGQFDGGKYIFGVEVNDDGLMISSYPRILFPEIYLSWSEIMRGWFSTTSG